MKLPFELRVAWRYLRERGRRSGWIVMAVGAAFYVLSGVLFYVGNKYSHLHPYEMTDAQMAWKQGFQITSGIIGAVGTLTFFFGLFHTVLSIFSTISALGVWLGTMSLVVILSVMNGFKADLQKKILGSNAHILVTAADEQPLPGWQSIAQKVDKACAPGGPCVTGQSPYLMSEVVVAADSNYQPVVIKGIDPRTVGRVTDLPKNVAQGSLDDLWGAQEAEEPKPPTHDGEEPPDFSHGAAKPDAAAPAGETDDEEPIDFSGGAKDGGVAPAGEPPPPPFRPAPRPLKPDPRIASLDGILVGRELARNLRLYVGEEVQVISPIGRQTPTGEVPRTKPFRVAGIFFTGMYEYDAKMVYVTIPALQRFLSLGDVVTGIEIKISDLYATAKLDAELKQRLGDTLKVKDWKELNRNLFAALGLEQIMMFLFGSIITLVAALSIISNLIMVVVEKSREIAVFKSMGASNGAVMRIFIGQGLFIGILGTAVGLAFGLFCVWAMATYGLPLNSEVYYIDRLPVTVSPPAIAAIGAAGIGISVMATIYPAYVGARLKPVDGLRK